MYSATQSAPELERVRLIGLYSPKEVVEKAPVVKVGCPQTLVGTVLPEGKYNILLLENSATYSPFIESTATPNG